MALLTEFPLFTTLPTELRQKIWKLSLPTRLIRVDIDDCSTLWLVTPPNTRHLPSRYTTKAFTPWKELLCAGQDINPLTSLLQVCRESRAITLSSRQYCFEINPPAGDIVVQKHSPTGLVRSPISADGVHHRGTAFCPARDTIYLSGNKYYAGYVLTEIRGTELQTKNVRSLAMTRSVFDTVKKKLFNNSLPLFEGLEELFIVASSEQECDELETAFFISRRLKEIEGDLVETEEGAISTLHSQMPRVRVLTEKTLFRMMNVGE
ncbi:hypothetical protein G7Y89_g2933 [Cudoniella acicularis]|uniref:2EXR domain-containing protein n=1 Tax=Cudoniella acicularis TaxID=354080 RepID=A0A8H4W8W6_9HELO|nr:hypothetical protein G7Y89_g2933 [Cudoniella acicularis]